MAVKLQDKYLKKFVCEDEIKDIFKEVDEAHETLKNKSGLGAEYLGWLSLPVNYDKQEFERIKDAALEIRKTSQILIVIGIGGSYLGSKAAIDFLGSSFYNQLEDNKLKVYFAGNNISPAYLNNLLKICEGKDISVNVISKSGTTTEPALAFRVFKDYLENKYGVEEAKKRIYVTTDKSKGTLKELSDKQGYQTFVIPDDVGGRFSVLTAVGLLPIAAASFDIDKLMYGANKAYEDFENCNENNDCYKYAAIRNILYRKGKLVEVLASYEPDLQMMSEWFKQLFGESEGKEGKGIFPASVVFSTDLHSMGQFMQDGTRLMFETVLDIKNEKDDFFVQTLEDNFDGLNFLSNQNMSTINKKAMQGTIIAHTDGSVPNIVLEIDDKDEENLGYLIYFFEKACAISGYMLKVNPFDQEGVEAYKKNMFALLGKNGYEKQKEELLFKINNEYI